MRLKKMNWVISAALVIAAIFPMQGQENNSASPINEKVYDEVDGTVIMEMENTPAPLGNWVKRNSLTPYTGTCYLEFMGNDESMGPADSPLTYKFRINSEGTYWLSIRSHKRLESDEGVRAREDMCNDVYLRVEGNYGSGDPELSLATLREDGKFWGNSADLDWSNWATQIVDGHGVTPARYQFEAGELYTVVVSGRAQRFSVDRIVVTRIDDQRLNDSDGESPLLSAAELALPHPKSGDGSVAISGEQKQWHKVTLDLAGPYSRETDNFTNPFKDRSFEVSFEHESSQPSYKVPGYFAADGDAAETSATSGNIWRAHLSPDKPGVWNYRISFREGELAALNGGGSSVAPYDGITGSFKVEPTDKTGRDFRGKGRLTYTGTHYLKFAGTGEVFIKAGPDSPESLLAYVDFDGTIANKKHFGLKTWQPHIHDWKAGDPSWKNGKGKELIGALNYLSGKGVNSFSFLTYNAGGDGDNVWPFIARDEKFNYDCSKLDQWGIVFDHGTKMGLHLHFKLQEQENDDNRQGHHNRLDTILSVSLDGGDTGPERKLYLRELNARFGHNLALNWNLGEETTLSTEQQRAMAEYISAIDPYHHNIVIHTFPDEHDKVYNALLGDQSVLTGASLQNDWDLAHRQTLKWVQASAATGRPWVVANDEQAPAFLGVPPDLGYRGYSKILTNGKEATYDEHDIRKATLWGNLMAGGAGVEYLFGYNAAENDMNLEDFRSRDQSWDYCRIAVEFFSQPGIPVEQMVNADELLGNPDHDNSCYCFAQTGELYLVYLPDGGTQEIDLSGVTGKFSCNWFNPRTGGATQEGKKVKGGKTVSLTAPSSDDWVAIIRNNSK